MRMLCLVIVFLASVGLYAHAQQPEITNISPPNWFANLPSPMLLIQGVGLHDASFKVIGSAAKIERTQTSANGHWAMLWLDTQSTATGTVHLTAHTSAGTTAFDYPISPRSAKPAGFSSSDVLYLVMPDRFADGNSLNNHPETLDRRNPHAYHGGDLQGIIDHLDYLHDLGVTALWLTPILQNDPKRTDYHGYGATDMYAVDSRLGTLAEYRHLADELHRRNMKLVFDDVPNHVGQANIWATDPPMPDWFHGTALHHSDNKYLFPPVTDPHAAEAASLDALDGWFVNILPDMNQQNPAVSQYLTDNMIWWIEEAGIDGLRIDTFPYVQRDFWQQYLSTLKSLYPKLTSVGEVGTSDVSVNAYYAGGRTLQGVDTHLTTPFDYPLYYTLIDVLTKGKPMSQLEETLRQDWLYPHSEALVPFISNHDQVRFLSQPGATPALLHIGFGLLMTMRGMPELYAGDEIDMEGGEDPDNRRDFPGGFAGDKMNAFTAAGRTGDQATMHDWVATLGKLRANWSALQTGLQQTILAGMSSFAYVRTNALDGSACKVRGSVLVVLNRDADTQKINIPIEHTDLSGCGSMTPMVGDVRERLSMKVSGISVSVTVPAFGFEVYSLQ